MELADRLDRPSFRWLSVVLLLVAASCAAYRSVPVDKASELLEPGDEIRVRTKRDRKLEFELVAVERDALVGADQRVPFVDVQFLWVADKDSGTMAVVMVIFLIAAGVVFAL